MKAVPVGLAGGSGNAMAGVLWTTLGVSWDLAVLSLWLPEHAVPFIDMSSIDMMLMNLSRIVVFTLLVLQGKGNGKRPYLQEERG